MSTPYQNGLGFDNDSFFEFPFAIRAPIVWAIPMSAIPLEDNFTDILGKAQRGLKLENDELATRAGVSVADLKRIKAGDIDEAAIQKVAPILGLGAQALVDSANKSWYP